MAALDQLVLLLLWLLLLPDLVAYIPSAGAASRSSAKRRAGWLAIALSGSGQPILRIRLRMAATKDAARGAGPPQHGDHRFGGGRGHVDDIHSPARFTVDDYRAGCIQFCRGILWARVMDDLHGPGRQIRGIAGGGHEHVGTTRRSRGAGSNRIHPEVDKPQLVDYVLRLRGNLLLRNSLLVLPRSGHAARSGPHEPVDMAFIGAKPVAEAPVLRGHFAG